MGTIRGKTLFDSFRQFGVRAPCTCAWVAALGILLWVLTGPRASAQTNAKNVLVIFSYFNRAPNTLLDLVESTARARVPEKINFYVSYPGFRRVSDKAFQESQAETIRQEYGEVKLDLVIVISDPAYSFVLQYRDKMFPGVPIVVAGIGSKRFEEKKHSGLTGVVSDIGIRETIDLALRLQPDTSNVAVIADDTDTLWWGVAHSELLRHQNKVKEIDVVGPPNAETLKRVATLPPHTVVLFQMFASETAQPAVGVFDVLDVAARRLPVYSAWSSLALSHEGVGGAYLDAGEQAQLAGEIVVRVLNGEPPDRIPVQHLSNLQIRVDSRQLKRWHIPESALPPGSVILYRPPTFWGQYRQYLIVAIALIAVLALLIVGLLWQRARRRKAEAGRHEAEERFRVMADSTPSLVWMCDRRGKITYLNERRMAFTGPDLKAGYGDSWAAYVHPDDVKGILDRLSQALKDRQPFSMEYRLRRSDGVHRQMFDIASPRMNGDGSFAGFIRSAIDVTDQKLAQQALEKVSGQLIEAQENERSRIARDLHDDICQRLALLSMEIEQANRSQSGSPKNLEEIRKHCCEIAGDVQSLSHELHSSKLDYLGVVAAIRGFCSEFSKQHKVSIAFTDSNVSGYLSKDVSLCLFRITQEALHNAVKYSGTNQFTVRISGTADEVQLEVRDAGTGFDVAEAKKSRGLGLVSMQERVHLVHGSFSVESMPGVGTTILAVVPFAWASAAPLDGAGPDPNASLTAVS